MNPISYEQIIDTFPDGITVQDLDFNIIFQNNAMREAFGCHLHEKCFSVYEKRSKVCEGCGILKAIKTGQSTIVLRAAVLASGETAYWENACVPLFDDQGKMIAGMEICRNVTSRVKLEAEVKDRNLQLGQMNDLLERQKNELQIALKQKEVMAKALQEEMNRRAALEIELRQKQKLEAIGQLAAGIAHEINTPLQYISDNTSFVRDAFKEIKSAFDQFYHLVQVNNSSLTLNEIMQQVERSSQSGNLGDLLKEVPRAIQESLQGTGRVTEIVKAMKEFSQPGTSQKTPVDLGKAVHNVVTIAHNEWARVSEVEVNVEPGLPLAPCYAGEINQVLLNVIINSAQAIAEVYDKTPSSKGKITINIGRVDDWAQIQIADTGAGIPKEVQSRIFDPFFTTKSVGQGTGQGLSVAYAIIVNRHGGSHSF